MSKVPTPQLETPLPVEAYVRLEALKIASAQHVRTNAVPVTQLIQYATAMEAYVFGGSASKKSASKEVDPLS